MNEHLIRERLNSLYREGLNNYLSVEEAREYAFNQVRASLEKMMNRWLDSKLNQAMEVNSR